jgi:hypothetical protein
VKSCQFCQKAARHRIRRHDLCCEHYAEAIDHSANVTTNPPPRRKVPLLPELSPELHEMVARRADAIRNSRRAAFTVKRKRLSRV